MLYLITVFKRSKIQVENPQEEQEEEIKRNKKKKRA